jgi:hypothetical protein
MMTANPEKHPADAERPASLREWLIDALALAVGGLAVFHYKPDGFIAGSSCSSAPTPSRIPCAA